MTSFSESRLELFPTKWQVTVSFDTLILENGAGAEMRYSRIVEPRFSFSASDMLLTKDEYDYLKAFFEARKGKFEGFRFTNPLDYQTSAAEVELATDITTQGILIETATAGEYQLVKRYTVAGVNCYKTIRKVKEVFSGPTIDLNSGTASSGGAVSCEYDLMVRFDQDEIELTHITVESAEYGTVDAYRVVGLQLVEDNYPKVYGYGESDFADLEFTFVPSPLPEVTKGANTVTRIEASQSQRETRISFSENKAIYKFGDNALYQPEVEVFYALFLACMGRKKAFTYDEVGVRFSSDQLTLTLEVWDGNNSVWQLSGLEVVATEPFIGPPPPPPPQCQPTSATFLDDFSDGFNWTMEGATFTGDLSTEVEAIWRSSGGDNGGFVEIQRRVGSTDSPVQSGTGAFWFGDFSYIPTSIDEAIKFKITASFKKLTWTGGSNSSGFSLAIKQNGVIYFDTETTNISNDWANYESSFITLDSLGASVVPSVPIILGFYARAVDTPASGLFYKDLGVDNLQFDVVVECP